tara:strand:- start:188 stop:322 length:135 start_codon:yes stop_codon:yes gene_type:complete
MKMSSDDNGVETNGNGARSDKRAKSSPSLFSLFEKMFNIIKKYW